MANAPQETWLEPAIPLYAVSLAQEDPQQAILWAQRVTDPEQRGIAIVTIARMWRQRAPDAVDAWLQLADLSSAQREEILAPQPAPRRPRQPALDVLVPGAQLPAPP
jgi:hypothetical protein